MKEEKDSAGLAAREPEPSAEPPSGECPSCGENPCLGVPLCGLTYIARSPSREYGGFHPNAIQTAKDAIVELAAASERERRLREAHGLMHANSPGVCEFCEALAALREAEG